LLFVFSSALLGWLLLSLQRRPAARTGGGRKERGEGRTRSRDGRLEL
jgi:hypothetical protein